MINDLFLSFDLMHKQLVSVKIDLGYPFISLKYTTKYNWKHSDSKKVRAGQVILSFLGLMIPCPLSSFVFQYHYL